VTRSIDGLQVVWVIRTTLGLRLDVVDLCS
jgi:hypothetical protein